MYKFLSALIMIVLIPVTAHAEWALNNEQSELGFISVKADVVAEQHRFKSLGGGIDRDGKAAVTADLSTVDTLIPIRDQRMKEFLFEVTRFPTLEVTATVDNDALARLKVGKRLISSLPFNVSLHGSSKTYSTKVSIVKLSSKRLQVQSVSPILVNAADFELLAGVSKLQSLAGLSSISPIVPVTFLLTFDDIKGSDRSTGYKY